MAVALARVSQPAGPQQAAAAAQPDKLESLMDVGRGPVQLALKPDGGEVFVVNRQSDTISEVITGTDDVQGAYMMGDAPVSGLVSRDNSLLYVSNLRSQNVIVYSIDDGHRVGWAQVGDGPSAMAFSAAGHLLFVVDIAAYAATGGARADCAVCAAAHRTRAERDCGQGVQSTVISGQWSASGFWLLAFSF
jgi:DNA-binding beta-propeller fold protein YncE